MRLSEKSCHTHEHGQSERSDSDRAWIRQVYVMWMSTPTLGNG